MRRWSDRHPRAWESAIAFAIAAVMLVACGGGSKSTTTSPVDDTPRTTATIVTTDNKFDVTKLTVPANQPVTVTVQNKGQALHNWHVLNVKDTAGNEVTVPLVPPSQSATVTFTLAAPGTYDFHCDTHPTEMTGTVRVQ
jgi:plastocyanin